MNREQKIDFLERLQAGETTVKELEALSPIGMIIKREDRYEVGDRLLTEEELTTYLQPYQSERILNGVPVIYGMIIR